MSKVLEFPAKALRDWAALEPAICRLLDNTRADAAERDAVLRRLRAFFDLCNRAYSARVYLPVPTSSTAPEREALRKSLDTAMTDYGVWLHDFVNDLMLERIEMEIERLRAH